MKAVLLLILLSGIKQLRLQRILVIPFEFAKSQPDRDHLEMSTPSSQLGKLPKGIFDNDPKKSTARLTKAEKLRLLFA
ncbi:hypothetical protein NliqN6_2295 [Naganishia liquefaciens]|uniref:Uncharacterized protein n=1 Tax=Naganishia liquefaciens TaxID=104408 RepID=A0A8H3TS43_9TREE|nr:hypothetical protein NliqN6_2295 [Naganishia liquefaciens]